jgi:multidrug efflux pump subunit AcrB
MRTIVQWAVRNSPSMNTFLIALLIVGMASLVSLRREIFPSFDLDMVVVTVPYPGATPTEVEQGICQKIEEAVRAVDGIKKVMSVAAEGTGWVVCELHRSVADPQRVLNDIRSEVDRIPSFPAEAEDPTVKLVVTRVPAIRVSVVQQGPPGRGPLSDAQEWALRQHAEHLRDALLQLPSISQVELLGARPYQIDVEISEETLRRYGLTLATVADRLRRENLELPGGTLRTPTGEFLVRGQNKHLRGADIARLPLVTRPDGVVLSVGDLGVVRDGFEDLIAYTRINGRPAVTLEVQKTEAEDILLIAEEIDAYLKTQPPPTGYEYLTWYDQSLPVRDRLQLLTRNGLSGLVLVFVALSVFLEIRLAFWVALGIPVSVLGACTVLWAAGDSLNMLNMFAFIMGLGIVVDDAIVIGENVYSHRQRGKSPVQAAIDGTVEVAPSVATSVTTTIIAFLPLFFVTGMMGKFIAVMPLAVVAMLVISLVEAFLVLPCHLAHQPKPRTGQHASWHVRMRRHVDRFLQRLINRVYLPLLDRALRRPTAVYATAAALMLLGGGLVAGGFTPIRIFPKLDGDFLMCHLAFPDGTPGAVTDAAADRIEQALQRVAARHPQANGKLIRLVSRTVGSHSDPGALGAAPRSIGAHKAELWVELLPVQQRDGISVQQLIVEWRQEVGDIPGVEELRFAGGDIAPVNPPIEFKLQGDDFAQLEAAVEAAKRHLAAYDGVHDIRDDSRPGKWEQRLRIKPAAQALGITLADVARTVRAAFYGEEVMRLQRGRHEVKLMVRYPPQERTSLYHMNEVRIHTPDGREVPLPDLVEVDLVRGYAEINRVDQQRSITVTADVDEARAVAAQIVAQIRASLEPQLQHDYPGVSIRWEGEEEQRRESVQSLGIGLLVALLCMFALLTLEFCSYAQPLIVLAVIPLGFVGVVLGHLAMGLSITLFSLFGLVALSGVVVNDSIVLIDFINHRFRGEMSLRDALLDAGRYRFRAVLLTSLTTLAGLAPIMLERAVQAQILIPMAASLVFGLMASTVWVLLLVPCLYQTYVHRFCPAQWRQEQQAQQQADMRRAAEPRGRKPELPAAPPDAAPLAADATAARTAEASHSTGNGATDGQEPTTAAARGAGDAAAPRQAPN